MVRSSPENHGVRERMHHWLRRPAPGLIGRRLLAVLGHVLSDRLAPQGRRYFACSEHPKKDEERDLGQECERHDGNRQKYIAHRH